MHTHPEITTKSLRDILANELLLYRRSLQSLRRAGFEPSKDFQAGVKLGLETMCRRFETPLTKQGKNMETQPEYIIKWRSLLTGATGQGTKSFPLHEAKRLAEKENREYGDTIEHWIEEVETPLTNQENNP